MEGQLEDVGKVLAGISEEKSSHRYAPEKWSIRQVLSHGSEVFVGRVRVNRPAGRGG
jgi:hypothetical protein